MVCEGHLTCPAHMESPPRVTRGSASPVCASAYRRSLTWPCSSGSGGGSPCCHVADRSAWTGEQMKPRLTIFTTLFYDTTLFASAPLNTRRRKRRKRSPHCEGSRGRRRQTLHGSTWSSTGGRRGGRWQATWRQATWRPARLTPGE